MVKKVDNLGREMFSDEYEMEVWKARSLAGKRVSTDGSSIENGSGINGISMGMAYIPTTESEIFSREPFLSSKLPKSLTIKDKGRFMLELCCDGCPRPEGLLRLCFSYFNTMYSNSL